MTDSSPSPARARPITTLFVDIGGVLLGPGWGHVSRRLAADTFGLDAAEMQQRHHLLFSTYELGRLSLADYLRQVVFYRPRSFSEADFREFMFAQSRPYPEMLALIPQLKARYQLKIAVVSNEGRELNAHRIHTFGLAGFVDFFVSSSFVGLSKPDLNIFRLALDLAQVPAAQVLYLDDQPLFVGIAAGLGIQGICHLDYPTTCAELAAFGLSV
ncbi:HAD family phosphatase [Hymenobacter sp. UV11]|uniref:HAD family hydrolase n=1 Tax=Hymenobacter sp. UV11 TaxID=1849735 RepID=UPI00105F584D|nr:HAD family phosphatase [Hymenobacter sp. UV11]TDN38800.1 hydrolase [Hymenobacter sp. UV11]TFZ63791.1 HAD family phosphatase [Hymenobacter sp. UV11]